MSRKKLFLTFPNYYFFYEEVGDSSELASKNQTKIKQCIFFFSKNLVLWFLFRSSFSSSRTHRVWCSTTKKWPGVNLHCKDIINLITMALYWIIFVFKWKLYNDFVKHSFSTWWILNWIWINITKVAI